MELTNEILTIVLEVENDEYAKPAEQITTDDFWNAVLEQFEAYSLNDESSYTSGILL